MNDLNQVLSQLKDVHEPAQIGWWPLAPGWYLLALICVSLIVGMYLFWRARKHSIRRKVLLELSRIERDFEIDHNNALLLKKLSVFLRRVAMASKRENYAGITGEQWLFMLDDLSRQKVFSDERARVLIDGPYQAQIDQDVGDLLPLVKTWARNLK